MKNDESKNNSPRDEELSQLLASLKQLQPPQAELQKWKTAMPARQASKTVTKYQLAWQLVAATMIGFVLGAAVMKTANQQMSQEWTQEISRDATFERTHTNLN